MENLSVMKAMVDKTFDEGAVDDRFDMAGATQGPNVLPSPRLLHVAMLLQKRDTNLPGQP